MTPEPMTDGQDPVVALSPAVPAPAAAPTAAPAPASQPSAARATPQDFDQHERWSTVVQVGLPLVLLGAIGGVVWLGGWANPTPKELTPDEQKALAAALAAGAASTLTFVTGASVAIERVLEGMWNFLGSRIGTYWPMTSISREVHELENELAHAMLPFHDPVAAGLQAAQSTAAAAPGVLTAFDNDLARMRQRFDDIRQHAPSNQRMQLLAAASSQSVNYLVTKYDAALPSLRQSVALADTAISGMQDFLATFKDNPGRRLISLYMGALLGLGLAALFQLDVFAALLDPGTYGHVGPGLRIAFTGILIGLGSSPTHEVIQALQQFKQGQKGSNTARPDLPSKRMVAPTPLSAEPA
jgi:hypothetical protein